MANFVCSNDDNLRDHTFINDSDVFRIKQREAFIFFDLILFIFH